MDLFTTLLMISITCFVISGVFLNIWVNGDRQRANFHSETKQHRTFRERVGLWSGSVGLLFLGVALITYFV
ncbi:DUF5316 family protein [Ectobacillus antri]|jgi:hypothetical protein|uniref:DUF5316 family protein n=1 Tax=Ectobacillus antri TaxID=2486280 RepID=A0ABT6H645_9BACI|nr:DUF5316 family protein [Ectobacillus antri]MDG4657779.1 DUF5316 family protein [Ectobacillus antri]MDG5754830.1 DUF5316 family protein [Ectobacillus antri]